MVATFNRSNTTGSGITIDEKLKVTDEELIDFTEQLRDSIEAGIPVYQALRQLESSTPNNRFTAAIGAMADSVWNGHPLSEAMEQFPAVFEKFYRSYISAGEKSGRLTRERGYGSGAQSGTLDILITFLDRRSRTKEAVKTGMMYPAVIGVAIIAVIFTFLLYVLPRLRMVFDALSIDQTFFLTRTLFWLCDVADSYWWSLPFILAGMVLVVYYWFTELGGSELWMHYQLKLKWIRRVYIPLVTGEACWLLGTAFQAGFPAHGVLNIGIESTRNLEVAAALQNAQELLCDEGRAFSDALKESHWIFEGQTYTIISTAEKVGNLGSALMNYGTRSFEKADREIARLVRWIEPALLVVAGIVVAFLAIAFYGGVFNAIGRYASMH